MHLIREHEEDSIQVENIGLGRIIWVPVTIRNSSSRVADIPGRLSYMLSRSIKQTNDRARAELPQNMLPKESMLFFRSAHLRYQTAVFSDHLRDMLMTHKVDILAMHWMSYDADSLIARARNSGIPYVFINHFDNERLSRPAARKLLDHAAAIGVVSEVNIPDNLRGLCVNLSDAVDMKYFTPEYARTKKNPADPIVLLPARIIEQKGHKDLIEAARILIARKINLVLYFAGAIDSRPLCEELRKLAETAGIVERVYFLGEKSAEEIREYYAMSSVIALPSYSEGLPRVLLEAQSMEKPFVAYDSGGMREAVLPGETGFLVPAGDIIALADKIAFLLKNESERNRMGQRGREFVASKFNISSLIIRHETFYREALMHKAAY